MDNTTIDWQDYDSEDAESEGYGNEGNYGIGQNMIKNQEEIINSISNLSKSLKFNLNSNTKQEELDMSYYMLNSKSIQTENSNNIASHDFGAKNVVYLKIMNINHVLPTCHYIEVIAHNLHNHMCIKNYENTNLIATIPGSRTEGGLVDMSNSTHIFEKNFSHQPTHMLFLKHFQLHIKMINITQGSHTHLEGEELEIYPHIDQRLLPTEQESTSEKSHDHYMWVLLKVGILKV